MGRNLERLVQKAKAARPKPRMVPANPLPIVGGRHAEVPERVDHLIAAGKLTEADRPRCVFWTDCPRPIGAMSVEQLAILEAQCEIARAKLPDRDAECSLALARILHCVGCPEEKSEIGDSL